MVCLAALSALEQPHLQVHVDADCRIYACGQSTIQYNNNNEGKILAKHSVSFVMPKELGCSVLGSVYTKIPNHISHSIFMCEHTKCIIATILTNS